MLPITNRKSLKLDDDAVIQDAKNLSVEEMKSTINEIKKITNSSNMKSVCGMLDVERKRVKFYEKVQIILEKFENIKLDNDNERLQTLFLFVMQSATDYLHNDTKEKREEICLNLLKPFVKDDEFLTRNIMNIVQGKVKPLTLYRKYKHSVLKGLAIFFCVIFFRAN